MKKAIMMILKIYIIYVIVFALVPYMIPKNVSKEQKEIFQKKQFYQEHSVDRVALVETPKDSFVNRIQLLRSAKNKIDIVYHTVHGGETTDYYFGEVLKAADRGVNVRILVDGKVGGMTSKNNKNITLALSQHPNVEIKVYNKINPLTPWKWNTLLHDKIMIIDDTLLLSGGRNIGDLYFDPPGYTGRISNDRDILVFNTDLSKKDSVIYDAQSYYQLLWSQKESVEPYQHLSKKQKHLADTTTTDLYATIQRLNTEKPEYYTIEPVADYAAQTVPTNGITMLNNPVNTVKKEPIVAYNVAQLALQSEDSVIIQTPYATANKKMLGVLTEIGEKNLDYQMLTNSVGVSPNFPAFSNYYTQRKKFLATGVTIYEFQNPVGSLHAKSYLFDDHISIVGSLNLDDRSFYIDTETAFVIESPQFYEILRNTIQGHQDNSLVVGENNQYLPGQSVTETPASNGKRALMWIVSIFSRLFQFLI